MYKKSKEEFSKYHASVYFRYSKGIRFGLCTIFKIELIASEICKIVPHGYNTRMDVIFFIHFN